MYLVEIEAGREALYESVAALASAIHRGDVGPQSRIFHRASSSWISITVHPEFKKAAAARAREPLPPLARNQWTFYGLEPRGRDIDESPATDGQAGRPDSAESSESGPSLRGLLGRVLRGLSPDSKTSQPTGS